MDPSNNVKLDDKSRSENEATTNREVGMKRLDNLLKKAEQYTRLIANGTKLIVNEKDDIRRASTENSDGPVNKRIKRENGESEVKLEQYHQTPDFIDGEMRDHQIDGLNWLITLYENGISGILGDEMGLGKTIQTISIFGYLKHIKNINGPFLVVAPLSTIQNWLNEVNRFCPSMNAFILYGTKDVRHKLIKQLNQKNRTWDLCITTYETCRVVKYSLARIKWNFVVLDEGHKIKNEDTVIHKTVFGIKSKHRLILTGTPLNNNLHELWALLSYVLPDIFSNAHDFDSWFDTNDCLNGDNEVLKRLHIILKPFLLRRIKADVEKSLLPKKEIKLYIGMTSLQYETYKKVLLKQMPTINAFGEASWMALHCIVMQLRKASNHPYLFHGVEPGPPFTTDQHLVDNCGKMKVLDQLLAKLKSQGSRVVLFSQFVTVLNIIDDYLEWKGYKFLRLDGAKGIADRVSDIEAFNAENSDIFIYIISTRAGGLGINLATADTVIIYDSDWNPQADFQAIDRVHRIGQTKQVHIYRLITENTVDHRIVHRSEIKQRLENRVIQSSREHRKDQFDTKMSANVLIDAIKFGMKEILSNTSIEEANFDLDNIIKESAKKESIDKEKVDKMTFGDFDSVYKFDGSDFRSNQQVTET